MTAYSKFFSVSAALVHSLLIMLHAGLLALLAACASPQPPAPEAVVADLDKQVILSEVTGRVLLVTDGSYRSVSRGMRLRRGERVVTVSGARAAITYSVLGGQTKSANLQCTVRLPPDSQFTIEDSEDCTAGAIVANNTGVTLPPMEQPLLPNLPEQQLVAKSEPVVKKRTGPVEPVRQTVPEILTGSPTITAAETGWQNNSVFRGPEPHRNNNRQPIPGINTEPPGDIERLPLPVAESVIADLTPIEQPDNARNSQNNRQPTPAITTEPASNIEPMPLPAAPSAIADLTPIEQPDNARNNKKNWQPIPMIKTEPASNIEPMPLAAAPSAIAAVIPAGQPDNIRTGEQHTGVPHTSPDLARLHTLQSVSGVSTGSNAALLYRTLQPFEKDLMGKQLGQTKSTSVTTLLPPSVDDEEERSSRVSLHVPNQVVTPGTAFEVNWQGPDQPYDYLTTVPAGAAEGAYNHYIYTEEGHQLYLNAPDQPGKYEIRYVDGATQNSLARFYIDIR
jgi:hypothetical protein